MDSESVLKRWKEISAWQMLLILVTGLIVALWPSWISLFELWATSSRYSHGLMIASVSCLIIYWLRSTLNRTPVRPCWWAIPLLAVLLFTWLVSSLADLQIGHQLVVPLAGWVAVLATMGPGAARLVLMPFGYLYLAIPVWDAGNFILQDLTVLAVGLGLDWLSIPALLDGNFVFISAGTFEIADGCSGIHFFIVALATSILFSYLHIGDFRKGVLIVLFACGLSMLANWVRVFMIVYAGYASNMQHYIVKEEHYVWGWFVFALFLAPFFIAGRRWAGSIKESDQEKRAPGVSAGTSVSNVSRNAFVICLAIMTGASAWLHIKSTESAAEIPALILPQYVGNWQRQNALAEEWKPVFQGVDNEVRANYANAEESIGIYANLYVNQAQGKELIGYHNNIEGDNSWEPGVLPNGLQRPSHEQFGSARYMRVTRLTGEEHLVLYWYEVNGRMIKSEIAVKLVQGLSRLSGSTLLGFIAVSATCKPDCVAAAGLIDTWLQDFAKQFGAVPSLPKLVDRAIIQR